MRQLLLLSSLIIALAAGGCAASTGTGTLPRQYALTKSAQRFLRVPLGPNSIVPPAGGTSAQAKLCSQPADRTRAACFATVRTDSAVSSIVSDLVSGLTPSDLSTLYAYPSPEAQGNAGSGQTVAIIVAGDYAAAESDLGVYRSHFGLPMCSSNNGCLRKIGAAAVSAASQTGSTTSISAHPTTASAIGWAAETDADTEIISAVCPNCQIIIAEAASDSLADLGGAVTAAVNANASIINASFGALETSADTRFSSIYGNSRHIKVVAAAGDWGFGVYYPASDSNVVAVGGTSVSVSGSTVSETAWSGTGSGCSANFGNPGWEHPPQISGECQTRNVADISADADPLSGVAIYDSSLTVTSNFGHFTYFGPNPNISGGWAIFGGTSISAPIITGMYALSGDTAKNQGAQSLYASPSSAFLQITSGSNGECSPKYLCTAMPGYNGPTGLGIPQGLGGF